VDGDLKWQDALNEKNKSYFDVCDGIFLNYGWDDTKLDMSVATAGDRKLDVYVGLDVFGRGCMGGGGYKSYQALNCIRQHGLSAAFFAPGWVFERLDKKEFEANKRLFWALVAPGLHCKRIVRLPFSTSFVPGKRWYPPSVAPEGPDISRCFFCLRDQELQPHWFCPRDSTWPTINVDDQPPTFSLCTSPYLAHDYAPGYAAGAVLKATVTDKDNKLRLFCFDLVPERPVRISLTYQIKASNAQVGLAIATHDQPSRKTSVYLMPHTLDAVRMHEIFGSDIPLHYCQTSAVSIRPEVTLIVSDILISKEETLKTIDLVILTPDTAAVDCMVYSFSITYV